MFETAPTGGSTILRLDEIINSNQFVRKFQAITRELNRSPGAVLITRRTGDHFVFLNASLIEEMFNQRIIAEARQNELMRLFAPEDAA